MENIFEKEIGGVVWRLPEPDVIEARILQLRIGKTLGAPFVAMIGGSISEEEIPEDEEFIPVSGFSAALSAVDPRQSVELIKDLCELTINGAKQRKTSYKQDFSFSSSTDVEVAVWVVESIFGNFIKGIMSSNLADQLLKIIPEQEK